MNPSRRERWPIPKSTRHVWVLREHRFEVPWQGFVLEWKKDKGRWAAHVVFHDPERDEPMTRWVPAERLVPVRSVPEDCQATSHLRPR